MHSVRLEAIEALKNPPIDILQQYVYGTIVSIELAEIVCEPELNVLL